LADVLSTAYAGVLERTKACRAEFPGARACKSEEVIFAADPPEIQNPDDPAWVLPNIVSPGIDISGAGYGYSCANLTGNNQKAAGMTVDGHGRYSNAPCTEAHRVACCVPSN
jgi:hypothetical protein